MIPSSLDNIATSSQFRINSTLAYLEGMQRTGDFALVPDDFAPGPPLQWLRTDTLAATFKAFDNDGNYSNAALMYFALGPIDAANSTPQVNDLREFAKKAASFLQTGATGSMEDVNAFFRAAPAEFFVGCRPFTGQGSLRNLAAHIAQCNKNPSMYLQSEIQRVIPRYPNISSLFASGDYPIKVDTIELLWQEASLSVPKADRVALWSIPGLKALDRKLDTHARDASSPTAALTALARLQPDSDNKSGVPAKLAQHPSFINLIKTPGSMEQQTLALLSSAFVVIFLAMAPGGSSSSPNNVVSFAMGLKALVGGALGRAIFNAGYVVLNRHSPHIVPEPWLKALFSGVGIPHTVREINELVFQYRPFMTPAWPIYVPSTGADPDAGFAHYCNFSAMLGEWAIILGPLFAACN
jgi:hypothetical protein